MTKKSIRTAVLFSGGKDSCLALHKAIHGGLDVKYLLCVFPRAEDSFMFHKPDLNLLKRQAKELGIELIVRKSEGKKEKELGDLKKLIGKVKDKIDLLIIGGIASNYQAKRIKKVAGEIGLKIEAPLWNYSPEQLWKGLLDNRFEVVMTKISCEGINKEFLGRVIEKKELKQLKRLAEKYKFDLTGEGGDFETAVLFMPGFKGCIKIEFNVESEGNYRHFMKNIKIKNGKRNC